MAGVNDTYVVDRIPIIIIEDNVPLSELFSEIINSSSKYSVIGTFTNCEEAIPYISIRLPKIVLMDVDLPGMNGVEGTRLIKKQFPTVDIIMVTVHENSSTVYEALCAGATGYMTKNLDAADLIMALDESVQGGAPMSIKIAKMVVKSFQKKVSKIELTSREKEVLTLLSEGNTYDAIGEKLFISKNTIKFHLKNIYIKLQVHSNLEAIIKAKDEDLI